MEEATPSKDNRRPSPLLPSPFPDESAALAGGAEGYEGEALHGMIFAGKQGTLASPNNASMMQNQDNQALDSSFDQDEETRSFHPIFTVVEDSVTGEQCHPHVHYVFSDDEPELMTSILLSTLSGTSATQTPLSSSSGNGHVEESDLNERYILLDMSSDGRQVISAQSLAPDWQIFNYQVTAAPTFNESPTQGEAELMLRIEGRERPKHEEDALQGPGVHPSRGEVSEEEMLESMSRLVDQFHSEMDTLKRLATSDKHFDEPDDTAQL